MALLAYAYGSGQIAVHRPVQPIGGTQVPAAASRYVSSAGSQTVAVTAARASLAPKMPSTEKQVFGAHVQQRALDPTRRMPQQSPLSRRVDSGYDHSDLRRNVLKRPSLTSRTKAMALAAAANCDTSQFASLSGNSLVSAVKAADSACINALFGLTGSTAYGTFREAQMVTIANALKASATYYNGTNADSTLQLVLYLRAGYYVQFYDSSVGSYGAALKTAIRDALDAFANNANFGLVNDVHGEILAEYVTLLDSSGENARYLYVVKRLLDNYSSAHNAYYWMKAALNNGYTLLFRGHDQADFRTLVESDSSIVDTLYAFANNHFDMLGGSDAYLVANAGRELGRFLQYTGTLKSVTQVRAKSLLDRSSVTGPTARLWVGVGEMVDYHDKANCSYYNLCDFIARVDAAALPIRYTCSATLRIRAQSMTTTELANTCAIVSGEENYFHQQVASNRTPVANDYNAALEMVVFNSSDDYGIYAGTLYGINTNNGGMYLEGSPADSSNQARFIAYEAEWLQPAFEIWNLTHEYIHYLDGRFDMYGDFNAAVTQKTVWWVEGFAEYMSYSYRNIAYTAAQNEAALGTYSLSRVFQNDYNSGTTLVYRWGYLAVRYMFEKRRSDVGTILGYFRPGNYSGYATFMNSIATRDDAAFRDWLPCVANPGSPGCNPVNQAPTARFSVATNGLTAMFTDSSSDPDGSIVARSWSFGDGTSSAATNPNKTYAATGTYTVQLTVTDDKGARHTASQAITVSLPECTAADVRQLGKNCSRSNLSATQGNYVYLYLYVPTGTSTLNISASGGSGNADLYVNTLGNWATTTSHNYRSTNAGNGEAITVNYPPTGYIYISLYAASGFSGARVSTQY
jgi:microbial collagenase